MKDSIIWHGGRKESIYDAVRIPGIIITDKGTLIAFAEGRDYHNNSGLHGDWAAIQLIMKRSTDGGETWSDTIILCNGTKEGKTTNNPVMIADGDIIHMLYSLCYGLEKVGGGVFYMKSEDDGLTWSEPKDISASCYTDEYARCLVGIGPGHGIVLSENSRNPGMLLIPVWMTPVTNSSGNDSAHRPSVVSTLYSLDRGNTWQLGEVIFSTEEMPNISETGAVELSDGSVMINMRNESPAKRRAVAVCETGYSNWSAPRFDKTLIDPICFGSILRYDKNTILFVNCASESSRTNLTLHASSDDGKTWEVSRSLAPVAGYADIAIGRDGTIYVLYEIKAGEISINLLKFDFN